VIRHRQATEVFEVTGVAQRLAPYETGPQPEPAEPSDVVDLVERALMLLMVMPAQKRETVEELLSPNDPDKGRRAVDALIESAFAAEDESGWLRRVG
jgi:hypothetical protein